MPAVAVGLPIWTPDVWADTVWEDGVWRDESTPVVSTPTMPYRLDAQTVRFMSGGTGMARWPAGTRRTSLFPGTDGGAVPLRSEDL